MRGSLFRPVLCVICFVAYMKLNSRTYYSITAYSLPQNSATFGAHGLPPHLGVNGGSQGRRHPYPSSSSEVGGAGPSKQIKRLHHLAFVSSVLALLHHILCHFMFALLYCATTFIKADYLSHTYGSGGSMPSGGYVPEVAAVAQSQLSLQSSSLVSATTPLTFQQAQPPHPGTAAFAKITLKMLF